MSLILEANVTGFKDKLERIKRVDSSGYYRQIIGGLSIYNANGEFYPATKAVLDLFNASSSLVRRINSGVLKAEVDHPKRRSGMSDKEFAERWLSIDESNVCAIFKKIEVSDRAINVPGQSQPVFPIWGTYTPYGVKKDILIESLNNDIANTAFSIRCLSRPVVRGGITYKHIFHIITFDFVTEPGINIATQYNSSIISGESFSYELSNRDIQLLISDIEENRDQFTGEDKDRVLEAIETIKECYGDSCLYKGW